LLALSGVFIAGRQVASAVPSAATVPLTADHTRILARADEILKKAGVNHAELQVRLQVIKATLTGTTIRPGDDYPEMRNPKHWTLTDEGFVVAPSSTPVEAIADLWVVHENDGVPIPRIRCYKYSSLILVQGFIQYFRETGNAAGLAAVNRLIGHREIPNALPNGGDNLLWKQRDGRDNLLPGDQVWFENPFFEKGFELLREEYYQQALRDGKSPAEAAESADAGIESAAAGEEGSNVFFLGDDLFIRGATNVARLCRDSFQHRESATAVAHEQILTPKTFTMARFQEHMVDDNYTAHACMRANPGTVHPADFKIESVRSPIAPDNLLRFYAGPVPGQSLDSLIDAVASHNKPPTLAKAYDVTFPLFGDDYDWPEQQRVRAALDRLMRIRSDDSWWQLRDHIRDERYVLTATREGVARNFTMGALCSDLIDSRLCLGFTAHLPLVAGRLPATFLPEQEYWQHETQWANERQPLYAMQAALCERAITEWETVRRTMPGSDGQSHIYTADEKDRFVAALKKEITERNQTKKAASEEVVVPCLPAPGGWEGFDAQRAKEARIEYAKKSAGAK